MLNVAPLKGFLFLPLTCAILLTLAFTESLNAQVGIASVTAVGDGGNETRALFRNELLKTLPSGKFIDDHLELTRDSIVFIAVQTEQERWKDKVEIVLNGERNLESARVDLNNKASGFVSLVDAKSGEVIRHRNLEREDVIDLSDQKGLDPMVYAFTLKRVTAEPSSIAISLRYEDLLSAPKGVSEAELKKWAIALIAPRVDTIQRKLRHCLLPTIAAATKTVVGPWKYDLPFTYNEWISKAREGFAYEYQPGWELESVTAGIVHTNGIVDVPIPLHVFAGFRNFDEESIQTSIVILPFQLDKLGASLFADSLASTPMFLSPDPGRFYRDWKLGYPRVLVISMDALIGNASLRSRVKEMAACRYIKLYNPSITKMLVDVARIKEPKQMVSIELDESYLFLKDLLNRTTVSVPVKDSSISTVMLELYKRIPAQPRIVAINANEKKRKLKQGLIATPLSLLYADVSHFKLAIGKKYNLAPRSTITIGGFLSHSPIHSFSVFDGKEALYEAYESKTKIWIITR